MLNATYTVVTCWSRQTGQNDAPEHDTNAVGNTVIEHRNPPDIRATTITAGLARPPVPVNALLHRDRVNTGRRQANGIARFTRALAALCMVAAMIASAEIPPQRQAMLESVRASVRESASYTGITTLSDDVMAAMAAVPREEFVPLAYRHQAYRNTPLPIAAGQTISQPLIVALMTALLDPQPGDVILEVGTGSGYQAAVLAQLVKHVYSIEIVEALADSAREVLQHLHYDNITVRAGDGYAGWPEHSPFDGIIVTAAAEQIPPPLLKQLKPGAKLVIPVGEHQGYQELLVIAVDDKGNISKQSMLPVRFVPLTGER